MATWYDTTLCTSTDLAAWESRITLLGLDSTQLSTRITRAKDFIASEFRNRLKSFYPTAGLKTDEQSDLVTTVSSGIVTSALSTFTTDGVDVGDEFVIAEGSDIGRYVISTVNSETSITLTVNMTATDSGLSFYVLEDVLDLILNKDRLRDLCVFLTLKNIYNEMRKAENDMMDIKFLHYEKMYNEELIRAANNIIIDRNADKIPDDAERSALFTQSRISR